MPENGSYGNHRTLEIARQRAILEDLDRDARQDPERFSRAVEAAGSDADPAALLAAVKKEWSR